MWQHQSAFPQQGTRAPSSRPCQHLFVGLLVTAILTGRSWHLTVALICVSLMTGDGERLLLCLWACCVVDGVSLIIRTAGSSSSCSHAAHIPAPRFLLLCDLSRKGVLGTLFTGSSPSTVKPRLHAREVQTSPGSVSSCARGVFSPSVSLVGVWILRGVRPPGSVQCRLGCLRSGTRGAC